MNCWRGSKPRKADVMIAKNYLDAEELAALNNLVEQYLIFAEGQAMRRIPMSMNDWVLKLHGFLTRNDRAILSFLRYLLTRSTICGTKLSLVKVAYTWFRDTPTQTQFS